MREKDEVMQGTIPSAVNVPLTELSAAFGMHHTDWLRAYGFPKPAKGQELIFYCRSGMRSTTACDVAKRNGYTKSVTRFAISIGRRLTQSAASLLNYKGSWLDWIERERHTTGSS